MINREVDKEIDAKWLRKKFPMCMVSVRLILDQLEVLTYIYQICVNLFTSEVLLKS